MITSTLLCLATAIFFEARDQTIGGMYAVGDVVLNRVEHDKFPDDVCQVVFYPSAFSFTHDGASDHMEDYTAHRDKAARIVAISVAEDLLNGISMVGTTATHYHATYVLPFWANHEDFAKDGLIGDHIFYTCSGYC
jgi:spore germination cell wall hydrolase CwlJ-like protein